MLLHYFSGFTQLHLVIFAEGVCILRRKRLAFRDRSGKALL